MEPVQVLSVADREGVLLEEHQPVPRDAIRADTAYVMTSMLRGVVQRGTAASAAALDWPLAGKTGTVNDYTDAWFVGFDPEITLGVWLGYDEKKPIGNGETGTTAALPIWIEIMKAYLEGRDRATAAGLRRARQHRVRHRRPLQRRSRPTTASPRRSPKPSSPARSRAA